MSLSVIILLLPSLIVSSVLCSGDNIVIETEQGTIRGQTEISRSGRQFYAFYGIPYAEPPVGDLRFEDPLPAKNWEGTLNATKWPPMCLFFQHNTIFGQEDCLYLNVYTPKIKKKELLPVMVFIYGGRYMNGHAHPNRYGAHYFMDKDIIIITFHYRQGPLGFLSTGDEVMPGNYGLKDLVEVLRWCQKHVHSYGGDRDRVTVAGGSSGGSMADMTMVSPLAKGLFHRCISHSAVPYDVEEPEFQRRMALKFTSYTDCRHENISSSEDLKSCLKKLPAEKIVENNEKLYTLGFLLPVSPFGPSIENEKVPGAFLIDQPSKLIKGNINIPWLFGINSGEGGMMAIFVYLAHYAKTQKTAEELEKNYLEYFPEILGYRKYSNDSESLNRKTEAIVKRYFADTKISENHRAFSKLMHALYSIKLEQTTRAYNGIKYLYFFDHRHNESFDKLFGNPTDEDLGVIHGDELISFFNYSEGVKPITEGVDLIVSEKVVELWVNFATYGDPNGIGEKIWEPMDSTEFKYLHIKENLEMNTEPMESELEFWRGIFS